MEKSKNIGTPKNATWAQIDPMTGEIEATYTNEKIKHLCQLISSVVLADIDDGILVPMKDEM